MRLAIRERSSPIAGIIFDRRAAGSRVIYQPFGVETGLEGLGENRSAHWTEKLLFETKSTEEVVAGCSDGMLEDVQTHTALQSSVHAHKPLRIVAH